VFSSNLRRGYIFINPSQVENDPVGNFLTYLNCCASYLSNVSYNNVSVLPLQSCGWLETAACLCNPSPGMYHILLVREKIKIQNPKSKVWFQLNVYHFHTTVKLKICKSSPAKLRRNSVYKAMFVAYICVYIYTYVYIYAL
jgi:hypothetical protein